MLLPQKLEPPCSEGVSPLYLTVYLPASAAYRFQRPSGRWAPARVGRVLAAALVSVPMNFICLFLNVSFQVGLLSVSLQ